MKEPKTWWLAWRVDGPTILRALGKDGKYFHEGAEPFETRREARIAIQEYTWASPVRVMSDADVKSTLVSGALADDGATWTWWVSYNEVLPVRFRKGTVQPKGTSKP